MKEMYQLKYKTEISVIQNNKVNTQEKNINVWTKCI